MSMPMNEDNWVAEFLRSLDRTDEIAEQEIMIANQITPGLSRNRPEIGNSNAEDISPDEMTEDDGDMLFWDSKNPTVLHQLARYRLLLQQFRARLVVMRPQLEADTNPQSDQQIEQQGTERVSLPHTFLRQMDEDTNPAHQDLIRKLRPHFEAQARPRLEQEHLLIVIIQMMRVTLAPLAPQEVPVPDPRPNPGSSMINELLDQQRFTLYTELVNCLGQKQPVVLHRLLEQVHGLENLLQVFTVGRNLGRYLKADTLLLMRKAVDLVLAHQTSNRSPTTQTAHEQLASEPSQTNSTQGTRQLALRQSTVQQVQAPDFSQHRGIPAQASDAASVPEQPRSPIFRNQFRDFFNFERFIWPRDESPEFTSDDPDGS
ncbi:hypothetical protein SBOR_3854 [Sclerotinia borealis F-4128]|uniref:Uncharacterized protein n=1 Tax=Sclerotinia borealis (strain F-4128) TaxID=1432307 RepID=W9CG81_SCLBF|nr:hypothetical protein SBOR_3854 [Sclerotinia borealis F-4128]